MPLTNILPLQSPISIAAATTIDAVTAERYYGQTLSFASAQTLTLSAGLPNGFWCRISPPASGDASIASSGGTLLNGATTTLTRAAANILIWVAQIAADSYAVTGS